MVRYLLSDTGKRTLAQFALSNVLLGFDYDGTLARIVANRDVAPMRASTRDLLAKVSEMYPCVVISGRARADVARYLEGTSMRYVIGNHGLEPARQMEHFAGLVSQIHTQLVPLLKPHAGIEIEDKRFSLAIHYRRSRQRSLARQVIAHAVCSLTVPVRSMSGKLVLNVLTEGVPHKGIALQDLRTKLSADTAIYIGDDLTDEDVFQLDQPGRLLGVRVGKTQKSAAHFYLRSQAEVDSLLKCFIEFRNTERRQ